MKYIPSDRLAALCDDWEEAPFGDVMSYHFAVNTLRALIAEAPETPAREGLREQIHAELSIMAGMPHLTDHEVGNWTDCILRLLLASPSAELRKTRLICDMPFDDEIWRCEACGDEWVFTDGTPEENHMNYCHQCGCKIIEIVRPEPEKDDDDDGDARLPERSEG